MSTQGIDSLPICLIDTSALRAVTAHEQSVRWPVTTWKTTRIPCQSHSLTVKTEATTVTEPRAYHFRRMRVVNPVVVARHTVLPSTATTSSGYADTGS